MTVSTNTFLQDMILFLRDDLRDNITDPMVSSRAKQLFVMTSYPKRQPIQYPLITVKANNLTTTKLGIASEVNKADVEVEVRVWARNVKEKDDLTQDVINRLRDNHLGTGSTSAYEIFGFKLSSANNVDEEDIKSKVMTFNYSVIIG